MSKINVHDFLMKNNGSMQYVLVEYDGMTEAVYFVQYSNNDESLFLPYPCQPYVKHMFKNNEDIEKLCASNYENRMKSMIVGNILYEVYSPQTSTCLPKEVDDIILITERECLFYLLNIASAESLKVKRDSKKDLRKSLIDSGSFDTDTIDRIMKTFDKTAVDYIFKRK